MTRPLFDYSGFLTNATMPQDLDAGISLRLAESLNDDPAATRRILQEAGYKTYLQNAVFWLTFQDSLKETPTNRATPLERVETALSVALRAATAYKRKVRPTYEATFLDNDRIAPELAIRLSEDDAQRCFLELDHMWNFVRDDERANLFWGALLVEMRKQRDGIAIEGTFYKTMDSLIERAIEELGIADYLRATTPSLDSKVEDEDTPRPTMQEIAQEDSPSPRHSRAPSTAPSSHQEPTPEPKEPPKRKPHVAAGKGGPKNATKYVVRRTIAPLTLADAPTRTRAGIVKVEPKDKESESARRSSVARATIGGSQKRKFVEEDPEDEEQEESEEEERDELAHEESEEEDDFVLDAREKGNPRIPLHRDDGFCGPCIKQKLACTYFRIHATPVEKNNSFTCDQCKEKDGQHGPCWVAWRKSKVPAPWKEVAANVHARLQTAAKGKTEAQIRALQRQEYSDAARAIAAEADRRWQEEKQKKKAKKDEPAAKRRRVESSGGKKGKARQVVPSDSEEEDSGDSDVEEIREPRTRLQKSRKVSVVLPTPSSKVAKGPVKAASSVNRGEGSSRQVAKSSASTSRVDPAENVDRALSLYFALSEQGRERFRKVAEIAMGQ